MQQVQLGAAWALSGEVLELGEAGLEAAVDAAAEANGPRGGAKQIWIKLTRSLERGDAFLEDGVAAADHIDFGVVTRAKGNPRGSITGVKRNRFFEQGDGLFVVLDIISRILAAEIEIVRLLIFRLGRGKFGGRNAERRQQPLLQRGGDVVVEFEDIA